MLYDEVLKRVRRAMELLEETITLDPEKGNTSFKDVESVSKHLLKAQDVVTELMVSLDFERGGEIARNLFSIYIFVNRELMEANVKKQRDPLENVEGLFVELRNTWVSVVRRSEGMSVVEPPKNSLNIAG